MRPLFLGAIFLFFSSSSVLAAWFVPYLAVQQNYAYIMSGSEIDNGGAADDVGFMVGAQRGSFALEAFYKGYTFINNDRENAAGDVYDITMDDNAYGLNLRYNYTPIVNFSLGYTNHTIKAIYNRDGIIDDSQIDGTFWGYSFGFGLNIPIWRGFDIYGDIGSYKVNAPISFFNMEIGLK